MARNEGVTGVPAACVGTVSPPLSKVERGQWVIWHISNDRYNPCPDLDYQQVKIVFTAPTMADNTSTTAPIFTEVVWQSGRKLQRRVHRDTAQVPTGKRKYFVHYRGSQASPDPELDIDGDCGATCGPGNP